MSHTSILEKLVTDFDYRKKVLRADRNQYTHFLKNEDGRKIILFSFAHIVKGLERKATLVDLAVTLGRRVRQKLKQQRSSVAACQVGWFILISFFEVGLLEYTLEKIDKKGKKSKYRSYNIVAKDKKTLFSLWDEIAVLEEEVDLFPSNTPPAKWEGPIHPLGYSIIKKSSSEIIKQMHPEKQPLVFAALNKLSSTPWMINKPVLDVLEQLMVLEPFNNPLKHKHEKDPEKRESLIIEISSILRLAKKNADKIFYHLYNVDFRGRIYANTAFLHEQGSDNAKGLLLFANGQPLGEEGFYWLLLYGSNVWGNDKVELDERVEFCLQNYDLFVSYAEDPLTNRGWIKADKPFSFLAFCNELKLLNHWVAGGGEQEAFISHLPLFIDG